MKVALCLHGYFDSFTDPTSKGIDGYNYIKKKILDYPGAEVDVFIHSWDLKNKDQIVSLYAPKNAIFEEQYTFLEIIKDYQLEGFNTSRSPLTVISHLYSVSKVMRAALVYPYDVIVKARFDLGRINRHTSGPGRHNPYPVQCINFNPALVYSATGSIMMANWQYYNDGPPDMWFYGGNEAMKVFQNLDVSVIDDLNPKSKFRMAAKTQDEVINAIRLYKSFFKKYNRWDNRVMLSTEWE